MNTHVPEEYGGPGLDFLSGCLIEEEFGWGCSGIGTSLAANGLAMTPVALGGSDEIKKQVPRDARPRSRSSPRSASPSPTPAPTSRG